MEKKAGIKNQGSLEGYYLVNYGAEGEFNEKEVQQDIHK